jgi:SAM-dependent methyltransferase
LRVGVIPENPDEAAALAQNQVPVPFFDTHFSTLLARTVLMGAKLGVLDALVESSRSSQEVASACGLQAAPTAKLLRALSGAGYVRIDGRDRYSLTEVAHKWLVRGSVSSVRDYVLQLEACEWKWIEGYEEFIRGGRPIHIHQDMSAEQWRLYQNGMRALATFSAQEVAERTPVPMGARSMLDLGGSHGYFSVALCRRHPGLQSVVLDLPDAVAHAAPLLAREGMGNRVVHRAGDVVVDDLGVDEYDLIFMSHAAHHFDADTNRGIARRVAVALRTGGVFVIQDGIRPERPSQAGQAALLLDLFCGLVSESGEWSFDEMASWQRDAGLIPQGPILLRTASGIGQQVAVKP